jgi:hypothetical protein
MDIDFPYHVDRRGRTATTGTDDHIRDLIEQVLFTSPGERVNRPEFGSGLLRLVFDPTSPEIAAAIQFTVQGALQRWLADLIEPHGIEVTSEDAALRVTVLYAVRRTGERRADTFSAAFQGLAR